MEKYYEAVSQFHKKFEMKGTNNEDMNFRLNLMIEELGELAQAVTKGKGKEAFVEENIDLLILLIGNFVSMRISPKELDEAFWKKHAKIMQREKKLIDGKNFRISEFK
jgi:NTP pyrophosphatase (non-canonical NTP hydrolase)